MPTHDELAYAVALGVVEQVRRRDSPWNQVFSTDVFVTTSRSWPVPDFVISDNANKIALAAEFKPPDQSKREYLTGLGQTLAYTKDFHYGMLVLPQTADDRYPIGEHVVDILGQESSTALPIGVLTYDPRTFGPRTASFTVAKMFETRVDSPATPAKLGTSFYAKWREISPEEMGVYLRLLYDETTSPSSASSTIRDRAFDRLWIELQQGQLHHWGGGTRTARDNPSNQLSWKKNYRNFISHIGWIESDGSLTKDGLAALHTLHMYGSDSKMFLDVVARAVLIGGKHLVFLNAINEFQDAHAEELGSFPDESTWLDHVEAHLENEGLLKRNPGRAAVALQ